MQFYRLSAEAYAHALQLKPDDACVLRNLATVFAELAVLRTQQGSAALPEVDRLFGEAYDKLSVCLRLDSNDHKALDRWGNALCEHATALLTLLPGEFARPGQLLGAAAQRYRAAHRLQPHNRDVLYNWGNGLRKHARIHEELGALADSEKLLREAMTKYEACTRLPREKKRDTLIVDTLINWGCALLALSRLEANNDRLADAAKDAENARKQFLRAAAVIKCEGLFERDGKQKRSYHAILAYNLACIAALQADPATAAAILRKALPVASHDPSFFGPTHAFLASDPDMQGVPLHPAPSSSASC
jgi:tetratricopeptide (TPR) repeat protein